MLELKIFYVTMLVLKFEDKKCEENMACGKLEIDILNTIWTLTAECEERDISIQDVVDELSANGVERAYTTIKTVMDRLTIKSILVRYKVGKKFFYRAAMNKREMALEALNTLSEQFFDKDYAKMMRFIENECSEMLV